MALLGTRLILDVRASVPGLLPYQDETVRALAAEAASLAAGIDAQLAEGGAADAFAGTVVQAATLRRAKRCLVAYHAARCERIEALRWNAGSVLSAGAREKLSNSEVDYFREYGAAVTAYAEAAKVDVAAVRGAAAALFRSARRGARQSARISPLLILHSRPPAPAFQSLTPPKNDRVPLRALADIGVVFTSSGLRVVRMGETHFMPRGDAEPLVRQGLMVQLPAD